MLILFNKEEIERVIEEICVIVKYVSVITNIVNTKVLLEFVA